MNYDKYIFLDYENTKDINIDIINEKVKMVIIIGENEDKIPVDLIKKTQPFGNSIEWLQIKNKGNKNALHFFIVYFLGHYISNQEEFIIYSENKDYDPLIEYLQNKNINVRRIVHFRQINENAKNSFFRNLFRYISALWNKMTVIQKIIFIGIILAVIGGFVAFVSISTSPNMFVVIYTSMLDEDVRYRITDRINELGYKTSIDAYGTIMAKDAAIARKIQNILIQEDLTPKGIDRFLIFDIDDDWFIPDFERSFYFFRAERQFYRVQTQMVKDHIRALDGVDDADVSIVFPKGRRFQESITASVTIIPRPGSDITKNRKKIEGIQKIIKYAVDGLKDENIIITDQRGLVLNDFWSE
jgi:hypothetical protein